MRFFDSTVRYRVGELDWTDSKYYHSFQQVGVPYMLCPDSYRLQRVIEMTKVIGDHLLHKIEKHSFYRRYCYQYDDGMLGELNGMRYPSSNGGNPNIENAEHEVSTRKKESTSMSKKESPGSHKKKKSGVPHVLQSSSKTSPFIDEIGSFPRKKLLKDSTMPRLSRRKFVGHALVVSCDPRARSRCNPSDSKSDSKTSSTVTSNISSFQQARSSMVILFEAISWTCKPLMVTYLHDILFAPSLQSCDCLLLDTTMILPVVDSPLILSEDSFIQQQMDLLFKSPQSKVSSSADSSLEQENTKIPLITVETKDIIHLIRHIGYKGLIVLLHPASVSGNTSSVETTGSTKFDFKPIFNPNVQAVGADSHYQLPLSLENVRQISLAAEKCIVSTL